MPATSAEGRDFFGHLFAKSVGQFALKYSLPEPEEAKMLRELGINQ